MEWFIEMVKKQGFAIALLLLVAWVLYQKMEALEAKWTNCEQEKFSMIADMAKSSNLTIERNTAALERNTEALEVIQGYIGIGHTAQRKKKIIPLTAREYPDDGSDR